MAQVKRALLTLRDVAYGMLLPSGREPVFRRQTQAGGCGGHPQRFDKVDRVFLFDRFVAALVGSRG